MAEKRFRSMEKVLAEGEDRISELPDSIIAHILSFLSSTKEAIRTSVLSKRWRYIWTSVPVLFLGEYDNYKGEFFSSVDRTIACRGDNKLQKFVLLTDRWRDELHCSHVNHWISYAIRCNVEELEFRGRYLFLKLPEQLFRNSCLKKLSLDYCSWGSIGEINLKNLTSLHLSYVHVTRESISKLLSGSPSLETLELAHCCGLDGLNITSPGLRKLIVNHYLRDEFEINAPNILSLEMKGYSYSEITLMDVGSVVEATLDFATVKKEMLKRMIDSLKHVNELKIGVNCLEVLVEMKNWSSPISRCKYLQINVVKYAQEIECLESTPRLVFKNECASAFTHPNEYSEIMLFLLENASVWEKIVIRASPKCDLEAKRLRSLLKLRGFIVSSKEELYIVLEKLK